MTSTSRRLAHAITRRRDAKALRLVARAADTYLNRFHNFDDEIATNGELRVMQVVAGFAPAIVFDVGANIGNWSEHMSRLAPRAKVHAFEPVAASAASLAERLADRNAVVNAIALGSSRGELEFAVAGGGTSVLASAVRTSFAQAGPGHVETCPVERADDYCRAHEVGVIDFAKIDVEGLEYEVLLGFGEKLRDGSVHVIQFEYGDCSRLAHRFLGDFDALLTEAGYVVGKVFPHTVDFSPYDVTDERWAGVNHVAVRADLRPVIDALTGS